MADNVVDVLLRARMDVSGITGEVGAIQKQLQNLSLPKGISDGLEKSFGKLTPLLRDYQKQLNKGVTSQKDVNNLNLLRSKIDETFGDISSQISKVNGQEVRLKVDTQEIDKLNTKITAKTNELQKAISSITTKTVNTSNIANEFDKMVNSMSRATSLKPMANIAKNLFNVQDFAGYNAELDKMRSKIMSFQTSTKFNFAKSLGFKGAETDIVGIQKKIDTFFNNLRVNEGKIQSITTLRKELDSLKQSASTLELNAAAKGAEAFSRAGAGIDNVRSSLQSVGAGAQQAASGILSAKQQVDQLKTSTQYFFSLRNMFNLLKRGIDSAVESVKNLDKAMTETAVVTKYSVSDMWSMLPQYTQLANELGATTQGAYETMTLYFQQGLDQKATFEIGAETMKMARIAGLDYAQTTDMMTAALRGFNMELNDVSAQRINDVYSQLAAKTASNTQELGEAMERTASIANSAGMSFEGTTAFLAQMIETTREAPENLGTAMKTIVARFQELKKNPLEISDVEGEEVSYNKIDAALQTIGVDLKDANGQFRNLDQVFLDISAKWDSLTQTQQRYIATTAAGSRQQSRFIAMMSNYKRTTELMEYANNSAGASQEQFNKTLDSFESKMNKLKNAWQQFTMGIANNQFVKGAVDGITGLLTATNKLIDTLSLGSGVIKSFLSLTAAFMGLKVGGRIVNSLVGGLAGLVDPTIGIKQGLGTGFFGRSGRGTSEGGNANLASKITTPILAELRNITRIKNQELQTAKRATTESQRYSDYKNAQAGIWKLGKGSFTAKDLEKQLTGLSAKDQEMLMKTNSGIFRTASNSVLSGYLKNAKNPNEVLGGLKAAQGYLKDQRAAGQMTVSEYYKALQDPTVMRQALQHADPNGRYKATQGYFEDLNKKIQAEAEKIRAEKVAKGREKHGFNVIPTGVTDKDREEAQEKLLKQEGRRGKLGGFTDTVGKLGSGLTSAGMGIQSFASLLVSSANPAISAFGTALSSVGGMITALGMTISGIGTGFSALAESKFMTGAAEALFGTEKAAAGAATALTGGLLALAAAVGVAIFAYKKHNDNIKKAAEDLTTNFKEKNDKSDSNISKLESYQGEYTRLSAGVDRNGNNINLSTEDYSKYLDIISEIAEINPEIVEGYNSQGHAIIRNINALQETLKLERKRKEELVDDYTNDSSLQKLREARDLQKVSAVDIKSSELTREQRLLSKTIEDENKKLFIPQKSIINQAKTIGMAWAKGIDEGYLSKDLLADYNIDYNKLLNGDKAAMSELERNLSSISSRFSTALDAAGDDVSDKTKESITKAFGSIGDASDQMEELIGPMYEQWSMKMAKDNIYEKIPEDMTTYFNQGMKEILSDANVEDIDKEISKLATDFANLGDEYKNITEDIDKAQKEYADTFNEEDYANAAYKSVKQLEDLKKKITDPESAYGQAMTEFLDNEISKIKNFTQDGTTTVAEALNTMTNRITEAEGALETFQSVAEGSLYSTASDNMKSIYDTVVDEKHAAGKGDQAYWAGAEAIFGTEKLRNAEKKDVDEWLKSVEKELQEGEEGLAAFYDHWTQDSREALEKIAKENPEALQLDENGMLAGLDTNADPEIYSKIAEALGRSEEYVTAMLNKWRQFGDISFVDYEGVRSALSTNGSIIQGQSKENGKQTLYMKESALNAELAGYSVKDREEIKKNLETEQNIKTITEAAKIGIDEFKDLGITSQKSLIETLDATGQFTKDEIQSYAEAYQRETGGEFDPSQFLKDFETVEKLLEDPNGAKELATLQSIQGDVASLAASERNKDVKEGHLDQTLADKYKDIIYGEEGVNDTQAQYFAIGKDKYGDDLTEEEYKATRQELVTNQQQMQAYLAALKEGRDKASTEEEKARYDSEIDAFTKMIGTIDKILDKGDEAYKEGQTKTDTEKTAEGIADQAEINSKLNTLLSSSNINPLEAAGNINLQGLLAQIVSGYESGTPLNINEDNLKAQMQELGIDIQSALDSGLVIDKEELSTKAQTKTAEASDSVVEGMDNAITEADMSAAVSGVTSSASDIVNTLVSSFISGFGSPEAVEGSETQNIGKTAKEDFFKKVASDFNKAAMGAKISDVLPMKGFTDKITGAFKNTLPAPKQETKTTETSNELSTTFNATIANESEMQSMLKAKIESILKAVEAETYTIKPTASVSIKQTKQTTQKPTQQKGTTTTNTVQTKTTGQNTVTALSQTIKNIKNKTVKIAVKVTGANQATGLKRTIDNLKNKTVTVTYKQKGNPSSGGGAKGINNYISHRSIPQFGSLAHGTRYGRLGPKGKGGLTLTGEKGFEIAWIPSESRSMILGVQGPQMINLPSDAVVYTHKQSKDILKKRQTIPAGSHEKVTAKLTRPGSGTQGGGTQGGGTQGGGEKEKEKKKRKKNTSNAAKVIDKAGKVTVWWENQTRKVEGTQRKVDSLLSKFEKELKRIGATRKSITSVTNAYKAQLNRSISLNQVSVNQANKELNGLTKNATREISYKKGKKTKKEKINLGNFITYDKANDTYLISQSAIDKVASKNKDKAQAIKDLAEKEINEKLSKRNTGLDNIDKAREALKKISNDLYETFDQWEKSITRVYLLTQKLGAVEKEASIAGARAELEFAKLQAGVTTSAQSLPKIRDALKDERDLLLQRAKGSYASLVAAQTEFKNSLDYSTYVKKYVKNPESEEAKGDLTAAREAFSILDKAKMSDGTFNYSAAISALESKGYNKETYDKIKEHLDRIFEKQNNYLEAVENNYKIQQEIYEKIEEYQAFIADFESDLVSGLEELNEDTIKKLDKLNSSLSKAFKELIDEVRDRLEARRQQEDNAKTEADIAKKQQRLAALRADTSGGHAVEIAQLEKEIADAQQSYQRTLEDQLLEKLQKQGDRAENQRQKQIDLLESQQEIAKQTGTNIAQIKKWLENPVKNKGEIREAWLANHGYDEATPNERKQLEQEFEEEWAKYQAYTQELPKYQSQVANQLKNNLQPKIDQIANNIQKLVTNNGTASSIKGIPTKNLHDSGRYTVKDLVKAGRSLSSIAAGGYKKKDFTAAGYTAKDLKKAKVSAKIMRSAGYSAKDLSAAGYSNKEIHDAGYSAKEFKAAGKNYSAAFKAGYSGKEIAKAYGAETAMTKLNMSGKVAQDATKASAKTLQQIVNKNPKDKAVQQDMAGVQVGTVDVNGKDKGGVLKDSHISASGYRVSANDGSTLYHAAWDTKNGVVKGAWTKVPISKLTAGLINMYPIDGKQALEYAIQNTKIGGKINKNFSSLVAAAKIRGKQYKFKGGNGYGSVDTKYLYYNTKKHNIKRWDPAKGKTTTEKFNKSSFLKKAQKNNDISREYAQALIAKKAYTKAQLQKKGVKVFATGGIADYTGPAWLDGTPSKPELVLNAQDTKNFLALRDVLSKAISSTNSTSNSFGDTTYEININVDHLNNDYDVDKVVERVKKDIVKSAGYRNVTQARNIR